MNGNKMKRALAAIVCMLVLVQCTMITSSAMSIAPEASVKKVIEVTSATANQVGVNYVYVDIVTKECDNDQTVIAYLTDEVGNLVTLGYIPVGSNKAKIKLGLPDSAPSDTYEIAIVLNKAKDVFKTSVDYVGVGDVNGFFEAVNATTDSDWNAAAVREKIDAHYNALSVIDCTKDEDGNIILKLTGEDYHIDGTTKEFGETAKDNFAQLILNGVNGKFAEGKGEYNAENSESFVKEAYLLAEYNADALNDEKMAQLIYRFETVIGFDGENDELYSKIENKDTLAKVVKTMLPKAESVEEIADTLKSAAAVQIVNEAFWENLVNVVNSNNDVFEVDEEQIDKLLSTKKLRTIFCKKFKGTYYTMEEIKDAWKTSYTAALKEYKGGGGGADSTPSVDKKVNLVSIPIENSENNKDPYVKIEDYYTDTASYSWASDAILNLTKNGIVAGYGDKTFGPEKSVTRAEFMKMVVNVFGLADITAVSSFADVDANAWYYIYVASAEKCGVAQGYGNGLFGINDPVTRQDAVTIIYRAAMVKGLSVDKFSASIDSLKDKDDIAPYAYEAAKALYNAGIYLDAADPMKVDMFMPRSNASRAYLAVILNQLYMFMNK